MPAKVCPRCGEQYEDLKSATCPQCFARLLVVDEATAEELAAARASIVQTPEFQAAKEEDDERFRQQSFGACLGVVAITVATIVVIIVLIVIAVHRYHHPVPNTGRVTNVIADSPNPLTPLPVAGASLADVMPPEIGSYQRRSLDQDVTLPSTTTPIFHAVYAGPQTSLVDVYALSAGRPTPEQNEYALGLTLAARQSSPAGRTVLFFATEHWHYAAISAGSPADFCEALLAHFRGP